MAEKSRTCFVISPIGPDGSDIRERANDFLDLLVEPALQKFNFEVIRADKIQQPTAITGDIIRLVQESDLCLIDLTDNNPNVFYECGRRHETGKPFIQMISKDNIGKLPFDVSGIRTVPYDLSSPREVLKSIKELQSYIQVFIDSGLKTGNSGESMLSLAQSMERIERKLNTIISSGTGKSGAAAAGYGGSIEDIIAPPKEVFTKALGTGEFERAYTAAQRFGPNRDRSEYTAMLGVLAISGYEPALRKIESMLDDALNVTDAALIPNEIVEVMISSIKRSYDNWANVDDGILSLNNLAQKIDSIPGDASELLSYIYNQIGMMYWVIQDIDNCVQFTKKASDLSPKDPSYLYNLGLAFELLENEKSLSSILKKLKATGSVDEDHLSLLSRHGML